MDYEKLRNYQRLIMSNSHIQRYSEFLSKPTSTIKEKYLTKSEVSRLIKHTENAVQKLLRDPNRSPDEKSDAEQVLTWIRDVKGTWEDEKSLHPNVITKLMKTSAGIGSGRFGFMKKGFKKSPDGKVPSNFSR